MKTLVRIVTCTIGLLALTASGALAHLRCASDTARVGASCVDKFEASIWEIPATETSLIARVVRGRVTLGQLVAVGAVQHGAGLDDYGAACPDDGTGCTAFYAVSVPGVVPSANLTWFQAAAACRNAGKRLPTNQEWQMAAMGTPDPGFTGGADDCNVWGVGAPTLTGSRASCVSEAGIFDAVGNVDEWVAEWMPASVGCGAPLFAATGDVNCMLGADPLSGPKAITRGGDFSYGPAAGVFAVRTANSPTFAGSNNIRGFRCAR